MQVFFTFFHTESRYNVIFISFLLLLASYWLRFLWRNRKEPLYPFSKSVISLRGILLAAVAFCWIQPAVLLSVRRDLPADEAHFVGGSLNRIGILSLKADAAKKSSWGKPIKVDGSSQFFLRWEALTE